jgi:predicted porin
VPDNVEGQKADQLAIGAVYGLSKRTAFYGTYSNLNNKGVPVSSSAASATWPGAAPRPMANRRAPSSA